MIEMTLVYDDAKICDRCYMKTDIKEWHWFIFDITHGHFFGPNKKQFSWFNNKNEACDEIKRLKVTGVKSEFSPAGFSIEEVE